jgi:hypothetical protein
MPKTYIDRKGQICPHGMRFLMRHAALAWRNAKALGDGRMTDHWLDRALYWRQRFQHQRN